MTSRNVRNVTGRKVSVSMSLSRDLLALIDQERGLATRSAWVEKILQEHYTAKPKLVSL